MLDCSVDVVFREMDAIDSVHVCGGGQGQGQQGQQRELPVFTSTSSELRVHVVAVPNVDVANFLLKYEGT